MGQWQAGRMPTVGRVSWMWLAAVALVFGTAGCGSNTSTTAATTTTAPTRTTDTFTGTVAVGGSDFHSFPVATTGVIDVTLTSATPPPTVVMGISVGIPANGTCPALAGASTNAPAGTTVQLSGTASPGTFCVDVHDAGNQSAAVSYTVTVTHP